ncbi:hypothetical protein NL676_009571 [Syzygium grande]|nr:hypothetical protein NL676_009571 [Syzygium grande]
MARRKRVRQTSDREDGTLDILLIFSSFQSERGESHAWAREGGGNTVRNVLFRSFSLVRRPLFTVCGVHIDPVCSTALDGVIACCGARESNRTEEKPWYDS